MLPYDLFASIPHGVDGQIRRMGKTINLRLIKGLLCARNRVGRGGVYLFIYLFLIYLGPYPRHMKLPRLGVESELERPAYTTSIATQDPRHICDLHHSSQQCRIPNPLSEARD